MSDVYLSSVWILDVERTAAPRLSPPENPSTRTSPVSVLMFDAGCPSSVLGVNRQIVLWIVQRWPGNKSAIAAGPDRLIAWLHCSTLSLGSAHMSPTVESWNVAVVHFKCGESTLSAVSTVHRVSTGAMHVPVSRTCGCGCSLVVIVTTRLWRQTIIKSLW